MHQLFLAEALFTILMITYAFTTFVKGASFCDAGQLNETTINESFLNPTNDHRSTVSKGQQSNGNGSDSLPPAQDMNQIGWDCNLEATSITILNNSCLSTSSTTYSGKCGIALKSLDKGEEIQHFVVTMLGFINHSALDNVTDDAMYSGEIKLQNYANLVNAKVTAIGCAFARCVQFTDNMITVFCLTDQECLKSGDIIYKRAITTTAESTTSAPTTSYTSHSSITMSTRTDTVATESSTPVAEITTPTSLEMEPGTTVTTAETAAVSTTAGSAPVMSTLTAVTRITSTMETITSFGTTTEEPNTICPNNDGMTDSLRIAILAKHNGLRSALALGAVNNGKTNNTCRKASKMPTLVYCCEQEKTAIDRAKLCDQMDSVPQGYLVENDYTFTKNLNRTLVTAANNAAQIWWSEIVNLESGIDQIQNLYYTHLGINSFAKMASDLTTGVGCAVVHCGNRINVVCHYDTTLANAVKLYTCGPTCNRCENGTNSCVNGLCPAASETCSVATTTVASDATTTTTEPNTLCPNNQGMTDPLRLAILAKHNSLRTALALGIVENGQTGIMLRKASKMPTLTYSCSFECTALARATKCSQMDSTPPQCISENSYNFTKNLNRTLNQAANAATQVWWSELAALESGIDQIQNLFYTHLGISSFAKIASDLTTKIGCAVVHCNELINVVCHYQTNLTNAVKLYTAGPTCKKCENGTDSCVNGLCPASSG